MPLFMQGPGITHICIDRRFVLLRISACADLEVRLDHRGSNETPFYSRNLVANHVRRLLISPRLLIYDSTQRDEAYPEPTKRQADCQD